MKKLSLCGLIFFIFSCNSAVKEQNNNEGTPDLSKIKQMEWVIGNWESLSAKGDLYEIWTKINDSTYAGRTFMISNKDTVFSETISLELRGGDLHYIPIVSDQNNSLPVRFKFISSENGELIFENKDHDFPQRVIYKNAGADSLYARIEGDDKGKFKKEEFAMTRGK